MRTSSVRIPTEGAVKLTRKTNYALRALILLAEGGDRADLKSLARELDAPEAFLGKILQALAWAGLVGGERGAWAGTRSPARRRRSTC
jgi:DNA-binding IscR family transcriptional regulator